MSVRKSRRPRCAVPECERVAVGRAGRPRLCHRHLTAERNAADPEWPRCAVDGCRRPVLGRAHRYCAMHDHRVRVHGDPLGPGDLRRRRGPDSPVWKDVTSYSGSHRRVVEACGSAEEYECGACGSDAGMQWSLDPDAVHRVIDPVKGWAHSPDPADYSARCRACHVLRDLPVRTGNGPRMAEAAGWILHTLELAGGRMTTRQIYADARGAGIPAASLSQARTFYLPDVLSDRREWWLIPEPFETETAGTG